MTMTNEEICRDYRQAKKPMAQIGILAQLNNCGREKIVQILKDGGEELPGQYKPKPKGPRKPKAEANEMEVPAPEPATEKEADENAASYSTMKDKLKHLVRLATLDAIDYITNDECEPAVKAYRIEGVMDLCRRVETRCEDE